nr:Gfo/Idh/MocA family oxidoreductase [Sphingomonas sp.]
MNPITIAILGFGKIAEDQHVPSIRGNPRFELVATSSRSGQGVGSAFTDWRDLIRSVDGLEAVAITTPPAPRYEIARECILAGFHCLLEKPPAAGLAEIADLECLAQAKGVSLFTTWHAQNNPAVDKAARLLAGKRIKSMAVRWHENVHKWHPGQSWIFEAGGFGVFDPGINAFSVITKIFPGAVFVRQAELQVPENAQTPIAAQIELGSPAADGPLSVSFDFRWSDEEEWTIEIETTDGAKLRLERGGARLFVEGTEEAAEGPGEYPDIYRIFADLIDERRSLVDVAPFRLVADCLLIAKTRKVEPIDM